MLRWFEQNGPEGDVVISSRVRLARNLKDYNFSKIKHRFAEIEEKKSQYAETTDELIINNIQVKERYLKQLIVSLYIQATIPFW